MMKKLILTVILVLILMLFFILFLSADVYSKSVERTEAFEMSGKRNPKKVEIKEGWLVKDKFAYFSKELSIIVDYQTKLASTPTA
jgi:cell division protein YceG involved in septum cleavage